MPFRAASKRVGVVKVVLLPRVARRERPDRAAPSGRLAFHRFGALGRFERYLSHESTRAGLAATAARERKGANQLSYQRNSTPPAA